MRYHLDCTTPVRPPTAEAIYPAQLCGDGYYRMVCDVHELRVKQFERWAEHNPAVRAY